MELLNPKPIESFTPSVEEFNRAWEWIFRGSGNPVIALKAIRYHAVRMRDGKSAAIGVYRRYSVPIESNTVQAIKMPTRKPQVA